MLCGTVLHVCCVKVFIAKLEAGIIAVIRKVIHTSALGPPARSYDGELRKWNVANNAFCIQSMRNNTIPFEEEILRQTQKINEYIMTSLRTIEGLDLRVIENKFSENERKRIENEQKIYYQRNDDSKRRKACFNQ